jgi:hypothetical protein
MEKYQTTKALIAIDDTLKIAEPQQTPDFYEGYIWTYCGQVALESGYIYRLETPDGASYYILDRDFANSMEKMKEENQYIR